MQKLQNLDPKQKNMLIIGIVVLLVIVGGWYITRKPAKKMVTTKSSILPENEEIQMVDESVKVDFVSKNKREAAISVSAVPSGTETIEYEVSYNTVEDIPQGAIGALEVSGSTASKDGITFGTCSSGTCRYHNVAGNAKVVLKFTGSYGDRLFEKEFPL